MVVEQSDTIGNNESEVSSYIRDYLHDPQRDVHNPYFTLAEVNLLLFSEAGISHSSLSDYNLFATFLMCIE